MYLKHGVVTVENKLKEVPKCCNKDMNKQAGIQQILYNGEIDQYVCLECGSFVTITEGQLDPEELTNFRETYGV